MSAAPREYECFVRVECYAKVTVWADDEDDARDLAVDAWDYSDLDASDVEVEDVREALARA